MNVILVPFFVVIRAICDLAYFLVVMYAVIETLVAFDILTPSNRRMYMLRNALASLMEPILIPIRNRLPVFRNFDLSPLVFLLGLLFFRVMVSEILERF